jgi:hypothetical protein
VWWPGIARLTRSLVLSLRTSLFIDAAVTCGTPRRTILVRHLLPNIVAPIITRASIGVGFLVTAEATLSFLGIGVQEPTPSWGGMIRDGLAALRTEPHLALFSSLALGVTIIGFNLLGDGCGTCSIPARDVTTDPDPPRPSWPSRDLVVSFEALRRSDARPRRRRPDVWPGEVLGLVGESGSGKSVTALSILGLLGEQGRVDAGRSSPGTD